MPLKSLNIIEFCNSILEMDNIQLFPAQEIILKLFYSKTRFNENLELTNNEIAFISDKTNGLRKHEETHWFNELVAILGRRSGKSFLSSLIACYEAYKLLCMGDPQKFFGINSDIWIMVIGMNTLQTKMLFIEKIARYIRRSSFFNNRISHGSDEMVRLRTDADIENKRKEGSVVIASGHPGATKFRGHLASAVIFDEMAFYDNQQEAYNALSPSIRPLQPFGEGRTIMISSLRFPSSGFFSEHFARSIAIENSLVFQIPTWEITPILSRETFNASSFQEPRTMAEFGANFDTHLDYLKYIPAQ